MLKVGDQVLLLYSILDLLLSNIIGSRLGYSFSIQILTGLILLRIYSPALPDLFSSLSLVRSSDLFGEIALGAHRTGASGVFSILFFHVSRSMWVPNSSIFSWFSGIIILFTTLIILATGYILPLSCLSTALFSIVRNTLRSLISPIFYISSIVLGSSIETLVDWDSGTLLLIHISLSISLVLFMIIHLIILHMVGSSSPSIVDSPCLDSFDPYYEYWDTCVWSFYSYFLDILISDFIFSFEDVLHLNRSFTRFLRSESVIPHWYVVWIYGPLTFLSIVDPRFNLFYSWSISFFFVFITFISNIDLDSKLFYSDLITPLFFYVLTLLSYHSFSVAIRVMTLAIFLLI